MPESIHDEPIEEIWATRRRVWEEAGGTWESYARHLDEVEAEMKRQGLEVHPRTAPPSVGTGGLRQISAAVTRYFL